MRSYKIIEYEGHSPRIRLFTKTQLSICNLYGVESPKGAVPKVNSINSLTGKKRTRTKIVSDTNVD